MAPGGMHSLHFDPLGWETDSRQQMPVKQCYIAGLQFHHIEDIWEELSIGSHLALVRDRKNKHDSNAVAIALAGDFDGDAEHFNFDFIIGYIPRKENTSIANLLDSGVQLSAEICDLDRRTPYERKILINIYPSVNEDKQKENDNARDLTDSKQQEETNDKGARNNEADLRAILLDSTAYNPFVQDLTKTGRSYFRWGSSAIQEENLPKRGEKVVIMFPRGKNIIMYLMHVVAKGADCQRFGLEIEDTSLPDDGAPYLLTNIAGPVFVPTWSLSFLDDENNLWTQPDGYLSDFASGTLKRIFKDLLE